jgi:alpha-ketoglutarate-dependent taurine dioxygenase
MQIDPLPASFGAAVTDVRLAALDASAFQTLYAAWLQYGLIYVPGQFLSPDEQISVAGRFGPLEFRRIPISNVRADGQLRSPDDDWMRVLKGNQGWHIDSTFVPVQSKGALLSAQVTPARGGETEWADMAAAYDALPSDLKVRIDRLSAYHSIRRSQALVGDDYRRGAEHGGYGADSPPPLRPLVKTHPETGRKSLVIGRHAYGIPGLSETESEALLDELLEEACQSPRLWKLAWRPGDVVIWDNRRTMHRGHPWDLSRPRVLFHTRIAGDPATEYAPSG